MNNNGMLVVVSAPSGCGKDTVFKEIRKKRNDIVESVSATTRKPREGEVEGVNYFFLSEDEFKDLIENNGLLEYAGSNTYDKLTKDDIDRLISAFKEIQENLNG